MRGEIDAASNRALEPIDYDYVEKKRPREISTTVMDEVRWNASGTGA